VLGRRSFLSFLSISPLALFFKGGKNTPKEIELPISCDLSFKSLQWAVDKGKENNLGKPKYLLIGPENKFVAVELLGVPHTPYTWNSEVNCLIDEYFSFEVSHSLPYQTWKLFFDKGVVISKGLV